MMDTPRPQRPRSPKRITKSDKVPSEARGGEDEGTRKRDVRIFDDLDLAAYIEEFLSVKVDEIATNLERTISDRLLDLVETNQQLGERLKTIQESLGERGDVRPPVTSDSDVQDLRVRAESLNAHVASLEARANGLQDEIYQLRDERATLKSQLGAVHHQDEQARDREQKHRNELKQAQSDLVGLRAEMTALTRQSQEARQKEEAGRIEASRTREELATVRAEHAASKKDQQQLKDKVAQLRQELGAVRAAETRLREENARLQSELGRVEGREQSMRVQGEELQRLQDVISALQLDLTEARSRPRPSAEPRDGDRLQALEREQARLMTENETLRARRTEAEQRASTSTAAADEAQANLDALRDKVRALTEQLEGQQREIVELGSQAAAARAERDRVTASAKDAGAQVATVEEEARARVAAAEGRQRETEERLQQVEREMRAEIEMLTAKKNALTETLRAYSDPDKFRDIKLREMYQQIETLNATMREKDNLLQDSGKEQLMLGQELEKVRKEKYESQVMYERRIKELQEGLTRETREKEKERQERHLLEEQLAKSKKKWW